MIFSGSNKCLKSKEFDQYICVTTIPIINLYFAWTYYFGIIF